MTLFADSVIVLISNQVLDREPYNQEINKYKLADGEVSMGLNFINEKVHSPKEETRIWWF